MDNSSNTNFFDSEKNTIFGKIYLANVRNRLITELTNPSDIDCKRWVWELVQNAKDSIAGKNDKNLVDIKINVDKDLYIFKHNGASFTKKTLTALIYKFSEGKKNDGESTGRFGTGFLTTHSLSKTVKIKSNIINNNNGLPEGFSITLYREGDNDELLKGLENTEKSFTSPIDNDGWTSYEYKASTSRNIEAGKLGIQNFKENIAKVMLFCPEINTIELNENGKKFLIKGSEIIDSKFKGCKKITFQIEEENNIINKTFLYINIQEYNKELSERFGKDRDIRICCSIELDKENNIVYYPKSTLLFCSLPLIGSESHILPFIINSPDFEPDSERQSILLDGDEINQKTGKISDPGINKMILLKAKEIYRILIDYICQNGIKNRHLLLQGITNVPNVTKFFDSKWYEQNFIIPMREILLNFPIIWNGNKYIKITETFIPKINSYTKKDVQQKAYDFIAKICDNEVPTFEQSLIFENILWDDNKIKFFDIEDCIKKIENQSNINALTKIISNVWEWLDNFLLFIKEFHPDYLLNYAIIPNIDSELVKLNEELATFKNVPQNMKELLKKLEPKWTTNHIHKNIVSYSTGIYHDINFSVSKIRGSLNNNLSNILLLMHYIPKDQEEKYSKKREIIYDFCTIIWNEKMSEKKDGNQFPIELWNGIDDIIIKEVLEIVQNQKKLSEKYNIDVIKKFLEFLLEYYPRDINKYSILPNQNGIFSKKSNLHKDMDIPEVFKNCLKNYLDIDIKDELLDKRLNDIESLNLKEKKIFDYYDELKKFFQSPEEYQHNKNYYYRNYNNEYIPLHKKEEAAKILICIIPKENENKKDKELSDPQNMQRNLFKLYNIFTKNNLKIYEIDRNESNFKIWNYSNKYIYKIIQSAIEKRDNLFSLSKYIEKDEKETIQLLKNFIQFSKNGKIIINQNNELCEIKDLKNEGKDKDEKIPEELKDISLKLGNDIRKQLAHENMERPCQESLSYKDFCKIIDEAVIQKYKNLKNYSDEKFKESVNNLIEIYFDSIGEKESQEFFPEVFSIKENIILNVICDKETRKNMAKLGKSYNNIPKILDNPKMINLIMEGKLRDDDYQMIFNFLGKDNLNLKKNILTIDDKKVSISFNTESISEEKANFYKNTFNNIINYGDDFDFENPINKRTGNCGEAYIYELLINSKKFKKVTWKMLSEEGKGELFEYKGKKYYINPDGSHYDIVVETFEGYKYFIEVKSTRNEFGNKVPFYISKKQIEQMETVKFPQKYILAVVFDVMDNNPKHFFMSLAGDIDKNI